MKMKRLLLQAKISFWFNDLLLYSCNVFPNLPKEKWSDLRRESNAIIRIMEVTMKSK